MVDLYVIEGNQGAGKSTLICHLTGVPRGDRDAHGTSIRDLSIQSGRIITALVFYGSPNEKEVDGQVMSPSYIVDIVKSSDSIDAIVLPLRPEGKRESKSDDYVEKLRALGNIDFIGYAQLGAGPFNVANPPSPIAFPGTPPKPPSNVIAEAVRQHWGWR